MNLARMMTDKVFFEDRNGSRSGPYKTRFGTGRITVFQDGLQVAEGDRVIQPLPDGTERIHIAEAVTYNEGRRNIPGHFSIALAIEAEPAVRESAAAGGNEEDALTAAPLQLLAEGIENSGFPVEQKDEARRLLRMLVEHPVVAAVLNATK